MPLKYDDEDGSWGRLSEGWPEIDDNLANAKYRFCCMSNAIPYGSYVFIQKGYRGSEKDVLRIENKELLKELERKFSIVYKAIKEGFEVCSS